MKKYPSQDSNLGYGHSSPMLYQLSYSNDNQPDTLYTYMLGRLYQQHNFHLIFTYFLSFHVFHRIMAYQDIPFCTTDAVLPIYKSGYRPSSLVGTALVNNAEDTVQAQV